MPISEEKLAQIRRKQEQFRDALLEVTQLWTRELDESSALDVGRRLGLDPILVSEFLHYWVNSGEGDDSWLAVADRISTQLRSPQSALPMKTSTNSPKHSGNYDVFISHASEDKEAIARPLYEALKARGLSVWFDEAELTLGDSLRRKIDDGLARCRYGIVILSPRFLEKEWPQRELDGLVARLLHYQSEMGKQLDSLADVVSFGVAPAMIIYQFLRLSFAQQPNGLDVSVLWLLPAFAVPCAGAYRLARFNLDKSQTCYFKGVPIPAAGLLVASFPLIYWYSNSAIVIHLFLNQWFWYGVIIIVCFLMVSRLPMMALKFKGFSLKKDFPKLILLVLAGVFGLLVKWLAIPLVFVVYVIMSLGMKRYVVGDSKKG